MTGEPTVPTTIAGRVVFVAVVILAVVAFWPAVFVYAMYELGRFVVTGLRDA